jgi:hypothetical protein
VGNGLLANLGLNQDIPRVSTYVDDGIIFFRPAPRDLESIMALLDVFVDASDLKVHMQKSHVSCSHCDDETAH